MKNSNYIELLHCPKGDCCCKQAIGMMNEYMNKSNEFSSSGEIEQSLAYKLEAFEKVDSLTTDECKSCQTFLRKNIFDSTVKQKEHCQGMLNSFFYKKRNIRHLKIIENTLDQMIKMHPEMQDK